MYAHRWSDPHVVRLSSGVFTARQECFDCRTERNPFTRRLTARRSGCWVDELEAVPDNLEGLPRVRAKLRQLQEVGERIEPFHPSRTQMELATEGGGRP